MRSLLAPALALGLGGCGTVSPAEVRDLRTRLEASERARAELAERVDRIDNQLFLLTDQVESQKVAAGRRGGPPTLPVTVLRPPTAAADAAQAKAEQARESETGVHYGFSSDEQPGRKLFEQPVEAPIEAEASPAESVESPVEQPALAESPHKHRARRPLLRLEGHGSTVATTDGLPSGQLENLGVHKLPDHGVPLSHGEGELTSSAPMSPASPPHRDADPATSAYRAAQADLGAGRYQEAEGAFRDIVKHYPRHDLADNAQYWIGETYYARKDYGAAVREFEAVVTRWPSGNKAPDAMLKLGFSLGQLGEADKARSVLRQVKEHYPDTEAAHLADKRLAELSRTEGTK